MSYQVLARKWRPRRFAELVGQDHVVRSLVHALDHDRVHHAFLFTGTRGVGKTTIARIFAKSLNCERGLSSDPCGVCGACVDIDAGRFLDLLEIDAASNTGVDDVREVIEKAQYLPSRGRYKVYLIDEVHMLSRSAFNALLKTLEEPPPHVKFLLATTDPQKLPVTVLSRCLQFSLKRLNEEQIRGQLEKILEAEAVAHDADAVRELARAGNGSMRDALSLLDQAIAYGGGRLVAADVRTMLGTVDRGRVLALLTALADGEAKAVMAVVEELAEYAADFAGVLEELAASVHRIQLAQFVPETLDAAEPLDAALATLAATRPAEQLQLWYQIAITGRRDLELAPSPRIGFEMTLLRMLAFRPDGAGSAPERAAAGGTASGSAVAGSAPPRAVAATEPSTAATDATPKRSRSARAAAPAARVATGSDSGPAPRPAPAARDKDAAGATLESLDAAGWFALLRRLELRGPVRELAHNLAFVAASGSAIRLALAPAHEHLRSEASLRRLTDLLAAELGTAPRLVVELGAAGAETLARRLEREHAERLGEAERAVAGDPLVQQLIERFDARVVPNSTRAVDRE